MKMEISKKDSRIIDEARDLRMVSRLRNLIHYLMDDVQVEDYDNYLCATELLNDIEELIWSRIEKDDEEDEECLRDNLKQAVDNFKSALVRFRRGEYQDEEILEILKEFEGILKNLLFISKK